MSKFKNPQNEKEFMKCVQNRRCTSSIYEMFEYKGMKTVHKPDTPTHFGWKKCPTPVKNEKIFIKCAKNRRCTSSICEQPLCKIRIKLLELQITQTRHPKSNRDGQTDGWKGPTIVQQPYSVFVDSLYYCKYLPIKRYF